MQQQDNKNQKCRVIALLTRDQIEFIDRLGMDALFTTGTKLTRVAIISSLIDIAKGLHVSANGVTNKKQFVRRVLDTVEHEVERRRYPRIKKKLEVRFRKLESLSDRQTSMTRDISLGGFCMDVDSLDRNIYVNQPMEFTIHDSEGKNRPIKVLGCIRWIRMKEDSSGFSVGVKMTYINENDAERFKEYSSS